MEVVTKIEENMHPLAIGFATKRSVPSSPTTSPLQRSPADSGVEASNDDTYK
jgi:hypothetical protein